MVLDSLRYWVTEMGVDGFRYDLATTLIRDKSHGVDQNHPFKQALVKDPVLNKVKHIAEPWDLGPYGYQMGAWGPNWSEWNDRFRNYVRDFWRGAVYGVEELATRLSGSPDLYGQPTSSVNFITAHDGFTMRDLVTYDMKHNQDNGEDNHDGSDDNRSWNCGWEGETTDQSIVTLRHRQVRNLAATLLLATGVPMITAGDEMGRTQQGNNNAYCQDSPISWMDWDDAEAWSDVTDLVKTITALRREHPALRPSMYRHHDPIGEASDSRPRRADLAWFSGCGGEMVNNNWHDEGRRTLGMYTSDDDEAFLIWFHAGNHPTEIILPSAPWGESWQVVASTALPGEIPDEAVPAGLSVTLPSRCVVVMQTSHSV